MNFMGTRRIRGGGVEEINLEAFLRPAISLGIYRVKAADGAIISDTALEYIGHPFDWSFDLDDDSQIYCTELLYVALKPAQTEHILLTHYVEEVGRDIIPLESISNSSDIEEILFIELELREESRFQTFLLDFCRRLLNFWRGMIR